MQRYNRKIYLRKIKTSSMEKNIVYLFLKTIFIKKKIGQNFASLLAKCLIHSTINSVIPFKQKNFDFQNIR